MENDNRNYGAFFLVVVLGALISLAISYGVTTWRLESYTTLKKSTEEGPYSSSFKKKEEAFANMEETTPITYTKCPEDGAVCVATASFENGKVAWDIYRYTIMGNLHVCIVDNKGGCIELAAVFDHIDDQGIILRDGFETIRLNGAIDEMGGFDVDIIYSDYY